jgi:hypothetical protein
MNRLLTMTAVLTLAAASAYAQGRGFGPAMTPSKLRSIPAETTAAKAKDPNWKAPKTAWGQPDLSGIWTSDDMRGIPAARPATQKDRERSHLKNCAPGERRRGNAIASIKRPCFATSSASAHSATRRSSSIRRTARCLR